MLSVSLARCLLLCGHFLLSLLPSSLFCSPVYHICFLAMSHNLKLSSSSVLLTNFIMAFLVPCTACLTICSGANNSWVHSKIVCSYCPFSVFFPCLLVDHVFPYLKLVDHVFPYLILILPLVCFIPLLLVGLFLCRNLIDSYHLFINQQSWQLLRH
jgi:hypothetical protein